ncbi:GLPGLI family protein [Chryseobacterium viscerum]|uniref:GLPGLI family protein n=1 Tax=Chryseobacterium viscerum TaxID=1037377 RepID=A0A316WPW6_9FLAO|nr:GLPGLI family protein [Chryseobacterium viscerum]KAB1232575.1 GLPGLI family protein [Chryseobacterium viscerum]PWN61238.1 GLPGLI family protein [Chryseobacterium viscerum]
MHYKVLKSLILIFLSSHFYAQNFRIDYQLTYKEDSLSSETTHKNMILFVQGGKSKFLAEKQHQVDSLRSTGSKEPAIGDHSFSVINYEENVSFKYYFFISDVYKIKELVKLNWELKSETKKIDTYLCRKAIVTYKGRTWEAWYTQDVPIQAGPYIFRNLPGLIVQMEDSTGSYKFSLYSIKKRSDTLDFENMYKEALTIPQKQLQKVFLDYYNDPLREMKSQNVQAKFIDEKGKEVKPDFREMTKTIQSRLKQYNNPIEVSEAIKYPK